jgi:hypothetical protein
MKKTYNRNQKSKKKNSNPPPWAMEFLRENSEYASSSILNDLKRINHQQQTAIEKCAIHVLADRRLRVDEKLRSGAVRLIVALLPKTFPTLEKLLSNCSMSLWYEIHFTLFSALDRRDLSVTDQKQVLGVVERYLVNAKSQAGFAAWKAGDILGDEWYTPETVAILERVMSSARYVAGRNAALHGIQHAMNESKRSERERLLSVVRKVALEDPSAEVRDYATYTLTNGGCYKQTSARKNGTA